MRICSYCGKEYPDGVVECSIDGRVLQEAIPPLLPPSLPATPQALKSYVPSERQLRCIEVVIVCAIAIGSSLLASILSLFGRPVGRFDGGTQWGYGILSEATALALLWYLLLRRSKSFADLGLRWKWTDIGWSIVLCLGGYLAYVMTYAVAYYAGLSATPEHTASSSVGDYFFSGGITAVTLIFLCINPFFEELIVRAYLMTEIKQLTNSVWISVALSTILQMSYHLYQGVPLALAAGANFFLWAIYYAKTNRITPIILAHLYFDVGSTLVYALRH